MFVSMKQVIFKNKEFRLHSSGLWVSQDGEVYVPIKCRKYPNGHFTYGCKYNNGYLIVTYKGERYLVHRLVADCWIENPDPEKLKTVDHINQVKTDNRVKKLRWADYSTQNKNKQQLKNDAKSKPVYQYTLDGILVREWPSTRECGRNGFNQGNVAACCRGELKSYNGYRWSYNLL